MAWKTGLWYWNTQSGPGTMTPHDAMVDGAGFGETIRAINGSLECDGATRGRSRAASTTTSASPRSSASNPGAISAASGRRPAVRPLVAAGTPGREGAVGRSCARFAEPGEFVGVRLLQQESGTALQHPRDLAERGSMVFS
ncbi:hypothetical protein STENM223S_05518 [Streptomyces tendae]